MCVQGNITYEDVLQVMPFGNGIDVVELTGKDLIQVLEYSVANYSRELRYGKFLQVSGRFRSVQRVINQ